MPRKKKEDIENANIDQNNDSKDSETAKKNEKKTEKKSDSKRKGTQKEGTSEEIKETSIEDKKKTILEKAKKLKEKIDVTKSEELKKEIKVKKRIDMLIPLEEYVKAGIYLGTRVVTPNMKPFVYRRRADGLAIFNTDLIDEKIREGVEFLSKFEPDKIILVCKRKAGWRAAEMFSKITGIRIFTKKYPAGILTNINLPDFFENELTVICDSWVDKNALKDTLKVNKKVLMICDTNNFSNGTDRIIIGNNKSQRSLGLIFYLLAREYCKARGMNKDIPDLDWWTKEDEDGK